MAEVNIHKEPTAHFPSERNQRQNSPVALLQKFHFVDHNFTSAFYEKLL